MDNTSGQGAGTAAPEEIKGISWGAFWWTFIWGIFNRVWFSLLIFVPVVGFFAWLILLFKGRQWAWQNKRWDSVEHFNRVQRLWGMSGLIIMVAVLVLGIGAALLMGFLGGEAPKSTTVAKAPPSAAPGLPKPPAAKPRPPVVAAPQAAPPAPTPAVLKPVAAPPPVVAAAPAPKPAAPAAAEAAKREPAKKSAPRQETAASEPSPAAATSRTVTMEAPPEFAAGPVVNPAFNDLMTAVLYRNAAGVRELLALGKWPDKPDDRGTTPLMAAVMLGDAASAEALLKAGADPNLGAHNRSTAVSLARERSDGAMTALLKRYGAR